MKKDLQKINALIKSVEELVEAFPQADNLKEMKSHLLTQRAELVAKIGKKES